MERDPGKRRRAICSAARRTRKNQVKAMNSGLTLAKA